MATDSPDRRPGEIAAAGGLIWRVVGDEVEVLLVHRDRYDDWSFPKGKVDPGESWEQAAVREVFEETGVVAVLGHELAATTYVDHKGRPKRARYWSMTVAVDTGFEADDEISDRQWVTATDLPARLTYERDVAVLESFTHGDG